MAEATAPVDRRAALKAKSRRAILDAAAALMHERRGTGFSVDELAAAADVSRRTVFNHFASLEDVVTEVAGHMLVDVVDRMSAEAASAARVPGGVLADLVATASGDRLVPVVVELFEILGGRDAESGDREAFLMQRAFNLFTERMTAAMAGRHPDADALAVRLLVAAFCGGLLGFVHLWIEETAAADTPASRRAWDGFVGRVAAVLREPGGA
ncbi:TetR/AcrR family transcriptional regulator [Glycomyces terrestris]|uniref:TetR/AcrR family transcriptional regulator n=1 Tax=Glycomyces terrestris TaxID=2493553 RepID=A0A426URQ6_9ACTN|nr:TetR/AcrR family transcriptional regulator [Glycomyces terrestris]RRR95814.1 TetR/AcrR family transcriptional regulator [Glycomyces terrestris]